MGRAGANPLHGLHRRHLLGRAVDAASHFAQLRRARSKPRHRSTHRVFSCHLHPAGRRRLFSCLARYYRPLILVQRSAALCLRNRRSRQFHIRNVAVLIAPPRMFRMKLFKVAVRDRFGMAEPRRIFVRLPPFTFPVTPCCRSSPGELPNWKHEPACPKHFASNGRLQRTNTRNRC